MFDLLASILLGISLAAPVGPVSIEVIKRGLKHGFFPAFILSLGAAAADTTYLLIIYFGLSNFISIPIVKTMIWFFGAIVLLYLGFASVKEYFHKSDSPKEKKLQTNSFVAGYLLTLSNPMTFVWWLGVFGSVLGLSLNNPVLSMALLNSFSIIFGVIIWFFALSTLAAHGKRYVTSKTLQYISLIAGIVLIIFGIYFGYNAIMSIA
jgi:threonine/homoserine/homoserine lactone efflux protein